MENVMQKNYELINGVVKNSNNPFIASIESGKNSTKVYYGNRETRFKFRTTCRRISKEDAEIQGEVVEYNGELYELASRNGEIDSDKSKKKLANKLSTYYAITKIMDKENLGDYQEFKVVIACPSDIFKNRKERKEYRDYIQGEEVINMIVEDRSYNFIISEVLVMAEGGGIIFREEHYADMCERLIGVVDIGGVNLQGGIYMNAELLDWSVFTLNKGTESFYEEVRHKLNTLKKNDKYNNYQLDIVKYKVENLNDPKKNKFNEEEMKVVLDTMREHLEKHALDQMEAKQWSINDMDIVFTGGGSELMKSVISDLGYEVSEDAIYDNATGNYEIGVDYFNEQD